MPKTDDLTKFRLVTEIKAVIAEAVMPLLKQGVTDLEADGFVLHLAEVGAEVALSGNSKLLAKVQNQMPMLVATYKLRIGATGGLAIAATFGLIVRAIRAGVVALGPFGAAAVAAVEEIAKGASAPKP